MKLHPDVTSKQTIKVFSTLEQRFRAKHGDKYDYSKVVYYKALSKVTITCPIHGDFKQKPNQHLNGQGCPVCGQILVAQKCNAVRAKSAKEFKTKAVEVHGSTYTYDKVRYSTSLSPVEIICSMHGKFTITPKSHLRGSGCPTCGRLRTANKNSATQEEFLFKAKSVHGDLYNYSKVKYSNSKTKVVIVCRVHGDFTQTPNRHLNGSGCWNCRAKRGGVSFEEFVTRSIEVHQNLYTYCKDSFTAMHDLLVIKCNNCSTKFSQTPTSHLTGRGCPKCAKSGFKVDKPAILYYLKVERFGKIYYKIGITNRTIKERFGTDMQYITVLKTKQFEIGQDAYNKEQSILNKYEEFRYYGIDILITGNTELFWKDVLKFDK